MILICILTASAGLIALTRYAQQRKTKIVYCTKMEQPCIRATECQTCRGCTLAEEGDR